MFWDVDAETVRGIPPNYVMDKDYDKENHEFRVSMPRRDRRNRHRSPLQEQDGNTGELHASKMRLGWVAGQCSRV